MQELRIVLTVLPVGPRGEATISPGASRWFAVQISAGFAEPPVDSASALQALWPWELWGDAVTFRAWLVDDAGLTEVPVQSVSGVQDVGFARQLRAAIAAEYALAGDLNLRWFYPGDPAAPEGDAAEVYQINALTPRLQYLATLPGEMARHLCATIYVKLNVDDLFDPPASAGELPIPKRKRLWIAPAQVTVAGVVATLEGAPLSSTRPGAPAALLELGYVGAAPPVAAFGPGFELARLVTVESDALFPLDTYWLSVEGGDRRYQDVESLLLDVVDRFAQLDHLDTELLQDALRVVALDAAPQATPAEVLDAARQVWRVATFAAVLRDTTLADAVRRVALRLAVAPISEALAERIASCIPSRWMFGTTTSVLELARRIAAALGLDSADDRACLRVVSQQVGWSAVTWWITQAFDAALAQTEAANATEQTRLDELRQTWDFRMPVPEPESGAEPTTAQRRQFSAERRIALVQAVVTEVRRDQDAQPLLDQLPTLVARTALPQTFSAVGDLRQHAVQLLAKAWTTTDDWLADRIQSALRGIGVLRHGDQPDHDESMALASLDAAERLAAVHVDRVWPLELPPTPELPGRGFALVVGDPAQRLVHEDTPLGATEVAHNGIFGEVSGVALLVRRGTTEADVEAQPWRIVTAGVPVAKNLDDQLFPAGVTDSDWLHSLAVVPLRPAFERKLLRADIEYHGHPMMAQAPLDLAYAAAGGQSDSASGYQAAYRFQSLGAFRNSDDETLKRAARVSAAPPLRYGDFYQFGAALLDQAGGLPAALAQADAPWQLNLAALDHTSVVPAPRPPMRYLRKVPVGPINVLPQAVASPAQRQWPALPADVCLRAREWWTARHAGTDDVPVLLFSRNGRLRSTLSTYTVEVQLPSVDEHTLLRWATPPRGASDADLVPLKAVLTSMLSERAANGRVAPIADPAVTRCGVRVQFVDRSGTLGAPIDTLLALRPGAGPFEVQSVQIHFEAADIDASPSAVALAASVDVVVPEGCFVSVRIWPLVSEPDFSRFAAAEVFDGQLDPEATWWDGYRAFGAATLLAESATDALPANATLYNALRVGAQDGRVAVEFANGDVPDLQFVDSFALARQRWVWRNRPVVRIDDLAHAPPAERARLAASGLPEPAFAVGQRDSDASVAAWERLATLDRGFISRGDFVASWPRLVPTDTHVGGCCSGVQLLLDDREGITAGDYLHYGLTVRSRYAGVLSGRDSAGHDGVIPDGRWRRIAVPFRGRGLKPPKILAVVPLTRQIASLHEPLPIRHRRRTPPVLVLLDEIWFREYGIGERLEARLARENPDIIGATDPRRPYRVGKLPDHYAPVHSAKPYADRRYFKGRVVADEQDAAQPERLEVFGPFGYTLDTTGDEALANVSAFLVYPPTDEHDENTVGPHWAMFLRFLRVLDKPSAGIASEFSDVYPVYTLPDTGTLAQALGSDPAAARASLNSTHVTLENLTWLLDPIAQPSKGGSAMNSDAASQYRYFLMVSQLARDAAANIDVELPIGIWRLNVLGDPNGFVSAGSLPVEFGPGEQVPVTALTDNRPPSSTARYRGRLLEVLVNGSYPGASRLDASLSNRAFWNQLLSAQAHDDDDVDAAGMIRRVSDWFGVRRHS